MAVDKAQFYWAIVGDSSPEPVAVVGKQGERLAYTIGCPDPFKVDGDDANIELIHDPHQALREHGKAAFEWIDIGPRPMTIPMTPKEKEAERKAREKRLAADAKKGIRHGYAGFGARANGS